MTIFLDQLQKYQLPKPVSISIEFMTDQQLIKEKGNTFLFDIECFPNYFLIGFKSYQTGKLLNFELSEGELLHTGKLQYVAENHLLVGFNCDNYDIPLMWAAINGASCEALYCISNSIILSEHRISDIEKQFVFKIGFSNHIDLQDVAPAAAQYTSLKHYGGRMHVNKLQNLPISPSAIVTGNDRQLIVSYNHNDLYVTGWLYTKLKKAIELRENMGLTYELDLRSLSDAQISEKVIAREIQQSTGQWPKVPKYPQGYMMKYLNPAYLQFYTPELQALHKTILDTTFVVDDKGGVKVVQDGIGVSATDLWEIEIGKMKYKLGIGGLHSSEKSKSHYSNEECDLFDRDVTSYYPAIILNQGLYPEHIGQDFLKVYKDIVDRRLQAKASGDKTTAHSLKICVNGCFGKLGSKWSVFYAPQLLIQVTISGQLSLLMLIEMLYYYGIPVVSANTDGIVIKCPKSKRHLYLSAVADWERITGFSTEEKRYKSLHSRDVNSYIAIGEDGKIKAKGAYVNDLSFEDPDRESLTKNPHGSIITEAVMLFLKTCKDAKPITIEHTIRSCKDIRKFLFVRRVNGGAAKDKQYLGKIVRWYMREAEYGSIKYVTRNAIVPESTGGMPLMDLTDFPKDIDYAEYVKQANVVLHNVGYRSLNLTQLPLFE